MNANERVVERDRIWRSRTFLLCQPPFDWTSHHAVCTQGARDVGRICGACPLRCFPARDRPCCGVLSVPDLSAMCSALCVRLQLVCNPIFNFFYCITRTAAVAEGGVSQHDHKGSDVVCRPSLQCRLEELLAHGLCADVVLDDVHCLLVRDDVPDSCNMFVCVCVSVGCHTYCRD